MFRRHVLDAVADTVETFGLLDGERTVPVALSGGKDSLFLVLALDRLGLEPLPIVVDMGFSPGWGARMGRRFARLGLDAEVVDARAEAAVAGPVATAVRRRVVLLDRSARSEVTSFTPCTQCYSAKVLSLSDRVGALGLTRVAFGHHRTDVFASFLKAGLMYIDRWDTGNQAFDRRNYTALTAALAWEVDAFARHGPGPLLSRVRDLAEAGVIDTDEPPRQPLRHDRPDGVELIRPLVGVDETEIAGHVARAGLPVEGSGCGHGSTASSQTPREVVHHRVLSSPLHPAATAYLRDAVGLGIDPSGRSRGATRYRRAELLGPHYRPPAGGEAKL